MKNIILGSILGLIVLITGMVYINDIGAKKTNKPISVEYHNSALTHVCGTSFETTLFAGQDIDAGTVTVENNEDELQITFSTIDGWMLSETHLAIGESLDDIPQTNNGNPQIGLFPYSNEHDPTVTEYIYTFSLSDLGFEIGDTIYIAAHAVVEKELLNGDIQEETAWGNGDPFTDRGSWAMYFSYVIQSCDGGPICTNTGVTTTFLAGQFIESGVVTVNNDGEELTVTFTTTDGWMMNTTHLAVAGSLEDIPQTNTGNPQIGNFPYQTDHDPLVTEFTYTLNLEDLGFEVGDTVYIAAHAAVEKDDGQGGTQGETAWADGDPFNDQGSWATYFTYEIHDCF